MSGKINTTNSASRNEVISSDVIDRSDGITKYMKVLTARPVILTVWQCHKHWDDIRRVAGTKDTKCSAITHDCPYCLIDQLRYDLEQRLNH